MNFVLSLYLWISGAYFLGTVLTLVTEDIKLYRNDGKRSAGDKFGYHFYNEVTKRFGIQGFTWMILFLALPGLNLIWLSVCAVNIPRIIRDMRDARKVKKEMLALKAKKKAEWAKLSEGEFAYSSGRAKIKPEYVALLMDRFNYRAEGVEYGPWPEPPNMLTTPPGGELTFNPLYYAWRLNYSVPGPYESKRWGFGQDKESDIDITTAPKESNRHLHLYEDGWFGFYCSTRGKWSEHLEFIKLLDVIAESYSVDVDLTEFFSLSFDKDHYFHFSSQNKDHILVVDEMLKVGGSLLKFNLEWLKSTILKGK